MPLISVIIPTHNRAHTLKRAIDSVLCQTFKDFELIIIDDGSSDNTREVLESYQKDAFKRIYLPENLGVSSARNRAVSKSNGEWLAFLDSDDEWLKNKLELQVRYMNDNPECLIIHGEEIWIRNGKRVNPKNKHRKSGGDIFERSLELCLISPSAVVLKRSLFDEMGGFREDFAVCEDYDLWLKITSLNEVGYIETPILNKYGGHEDQLSTKFFAMDLWRVESMLWVLGSRPNMSENKRSIVREIIDKKVKVLQKGYIKHGNTQGMDKLANLLLKYQYNY